jgi:predicted outer membrane repeat protein
VHCQGVEKLKIVGLKFILSFGKNGSYREMSALKFIHSEGMTIDSTSFQGSGNFALGLTRALYIQYSSATVTSCQFLGNTGNYGGAIHASRWSHITLNNSIFKENKALVDYGGGGAVFLAVQSVLTINGSIFEGNQAILGGAMRSLYSSVAVTNSVFLRNQGDNGGVIRAERSNAMLNTSAFIKNRAEEEGGVISAYKSSEIMVDGSIFKGNRAIFGGAIIAGEESTVHISSFPGDAAAGVPGHCNATSYWEEHLSLMGTFCSGEIQVSLGTTYFLSNIATHNGGAIYADHILTFTGNKIVFRNNSASNDGGAVHSDHYVSLSASPVDVRASYIRFEDNRAVIEGGAMYISSSRVRFLSSVSATFSGNEAQRGGAIMLNRYSQATLNGTVMKFEKNTADFGGAIDGDNSDLIVNAAVLEFVNNHARGNGGALRLDGRETLLNPQTKNFALFFANYSKFDGNWADNGGGAIYVRYLTTCEFSEAVYFSRNMAGTDGGAINALESRILFKESSSVTFQHNSAQNGGAVYISNAAYLYLEQLTILHSSHNHADQYGGVIYHEDVTVPNQCFLDKVDTRDFPFCFFQLRTWGDNLLSEASSYNDTSVKGGEFMYGGLLDRCRLYT